MFLYLDDVGSMACSGTKSSKSANADVAGKTDLKEKVKEWRRRKGHRPSIDKNLSICELVATFEGKSGRSKIEVGRL